MLIRALIIVLSIILIDAYFYTAFKVLFLNQSEKAKQLSKNIYWAVSASLFLIVAISLFYPMQYWPRSIRVFCVGFALVMAIGKVIGVIFILLDDLINLTKFVFVKVRKKSEFNVSRNYFLRKSAVTIAGISFSGLLYGIFKTAFQYKIHRVDLKLKSLPKNFNGLKIIQISDIHSGTYVNSEPLQKAVELILAEKPDIIFFTGDLVNEITDEVEPFLDDLKKLQAPMGVYSILGNHDYGDYFPFKTPQDKAENLERLIQHQKDLGWNILLNEHRILTKGDESIAIVGVENWGSALRFPKKGDVPKAINGAEHIACKLLLSHDPSHWESVIQKQHDDIEVMFAGHTHGMQMGVEIPGFKWSPVQYVYKQWAGLYEKGNQKLYVNRGLGVIGYPGRLGILPEITVFTLNKG